MKLSSLFPLSGKASSVIVNLLDSVVKKSENAHLGSAGVSHASASLWASLLSGLSRSSQSRRARVASEASGNHVTTLRDFQMLQRLRESRAFSHNFQRVGRSCVSPDTTTGPVVGL